MPTYISYCKWTQQGVQSVKESPSRLDAAKRAFEGFGVSIRAFYLTTGQYDFVVISEGPDDTAVARALLSILSKGAFHSETARAFDEEEYRNLIGSLP